MIKSRNVKILYWLEIGRIVMWSFYRTQLPVSAPIFHLQTVPFKMWPSDSVFSTRSARWKIPSKEKWRNQPEAWKKSRSLITKLVPLLNSGSQSFSSRHRRWSRDDMLSFVAGRSVDVSLCCVVFGSEAFVWWSKFACVVRVLSNLSLLN